MIDWGFDEDDDCLPLLVICYCKWDIKEGRLRTRCGGNFLLEDDRHNFYKYCPRCGKEIDRE